MRVLMNAEEAAATGGVELSTLQLAEGLHARGHQIDLLYRLGGNLESRYRAVTGSMTQVPGFTVEVAHPLPGLARLPKAVLAARRGRPDIVYLNRSEQLVWGIAASRLNGVPLVCHLRHHPFAPPMVKLLGRSASRYVAISDYIRDLWVSAGLPPERVTVVHNGIDPGSYPFGADAERRSARAEIGLPPEAPVALCYGRMEAEKGVEHLVRAWSSLHPDRGILVVCGVGPSDEATLEGLRRAHPGGPAVRWVAPRHDVTTLLHAADVVALPAQWDEPFGRVLIEAMASGRPAVATRTGGVPEVLTGPFARFLVDRRDAGALAKVIDGALDWRLNEPGLGEQCRRHVTENFTLERVLDEVEEILAAATRSHRTGLRGPALGTGGVR